MAEDDEGYEDRQTYLLQRSMASSRLVIRATMMTGPSNLRPSGAFALQT